MRTVFFMAIAVIIFPSFVFSAPVGNPANPVLLKGDNNFKLGAMFDFVSERELDVTGESVELEANFYTAKLAYTFADRLDVYVLLGMIDEAEVDEKVGSDSYKYFFDEDFSWGIGATFLVHEFENGIKLGADAKYRVAEADLTALDINGTKYEISDITDVQGDYDEWQIALGIAKQLGKFVPYAGVKYSDVELQAKGTIAGTTYETNNVNSEEVIGVFVGISFLPKDNFSINLEGRFIDETAFSLGCNYRF